LGLRDDLRVEEGQLTIDGLSCTRLADQYGTPLYVLSESRIRRNYESFHGELAKIYSNVLVCPAYKANSHLAVSRIYHSEGAGAEVVSAAELRTALESSVPPENIVYNGPVKKAQDLEFAISSDVGLINADSLSELERLQEAAKRVKKPANVGLRINLGMKTETHPHLATALREHKFGIWVGDAISAYTENVNKSELNMIGIQCHIGSNITQPQTFREMTAEMLRLVSEVNEKVGLKLTMVDLGGGLGVAYQPDSPTITYGEYANAILAENLETLERLGRPALIFEPGRAIVADAGLLLTRVEVVKRQGNTNWAIVDAGMNTFLRPALYNAKHQVVAAQRRSNKPSAKYHLGGPCCESADVIAKDIILPTIKEGDVLGVLDVGAYGYTMSSNYNGQPRPAVVLTRDGESELIRRRENYQDLVAGEIIPPHLR
jgi:diaminopimelate decarboxylase